MRIAEFALDGHGAWPDLRARSLADGLTVFFGPPGTGKSTVANLIGHVLYGRRPTSVSAMRTARTQPEGELIVQRGNDRYRLRRYNDVAPPGRLTVSSLDGRAVDSHTVEKLLSAGPCVVAAQLYLADFRAPGGLERLLSSDFARAFRASLGDDRHGATTQHGAQLRTLLNRRDELTQQLEDRLAADRQRSREFEDRLEELEALRQERRREYEQLRELLQSVDTNLADCEAQLRYGQLESMVQQQQSAAVPADLDVRLADVDEQIERWRRALADLERREAGVRARLAQLHPDDATNELPLADQRAYLSVVRRLIADLEGELARLARAADPRGCVCREAHQRLRPIAETLATQTALLDRSLVEQELVAEYLDLRGEAEHLGRSKSELQEQLNHLLDRRQVLVRTGRPTRRRVARDGQEHIGRNGSAVLEYDALAARQAQLERERASLIERLKSSEQTLEDLTRRCEQLARDRASLLSGAAIEELRQELAALEAQLHPQFVHAADVPDVGYAQRAPRASDFLAQLSSGELIQVRQGPKGRATIVRRDGTHVPTEQLQLAERALALLALTLSLVTAHSRRGPLLPLVLDEPFDELNDRQIAAVAAVLHEFGRSGRQVVVFTRSAAAIERFQSLGAEVRGMHELRCASDADFDLRSYVETGRDRPVATDAVPAPRTVELSPPTADQFCLHEDDPISVFPALGSETGAAFASIGIRTVGDLIEADSKVVSEQLAREGVSPALVRLWQTHQVLMCFVPGVTLDDAQVLTGAGVYSVDDLLDIDDADLENHVHAYLQSPRGQRFRQHGYRLGNRLHGWRRGAQDHYARWANSPRGSRWRKRGESHRSEPLVDTITTAANPPTKQQSPSLEPRRSPTSSQLERSSPIEQAPSIGPKTAVRLAAIGIHTVDDLLFADAADLAQRLDVRQITTDKVVTWQQQAYLVCDLPRLRARDAQILVACGLTNAESIARMKPAELVSLVKPFCRSSEGERILRGGDEPDEVECADWIKWARQRSALEAA